MNDDHRKYRAMNRYHDATTSAYDGEEIVRQYAAYIVADGALEQDDFDPGASSVYHYLFGRNIHQPSEPLMRDAFNYVRRTPMYAVYLTREMNDSMFDENFGDVLERSAESFMSSSFANYMTDYVIRQLAHDHEAALVRRVDLPAER